MVSQADSEGSRQTQLSSEQIQRIEDNRRKALALQQSKRTLKDAIAAQPHAEGPPAASAAPPTRARGGKGAVGMAGKGKGSPPKQAPRAATDITPEKLSPPPKPACGIWGQYHRLYAARMRQLHGAVMEQARALWGGMVPPEGFMPDIQGYRRGVNGSEVVLAGIIFKEMKSRPNVIEQYRDGKSIGGIPQLSMADAKRPLCTDDDALFLEDNIMRLQLSVSNEDLGRLATGLVVAVRGVARPDGKFQVAAFCMARMPPVPALTSPDGSAAGLGPFLALVSGFGLDISRSGLAKARERAVAFLVGNGSCDREVCLGRAVRQVIICGGTITDAFAAGGVTKAALVEADALLSRLAEAVPVHVMPGRGDPTNSSLPQLPLHSRLFRHARAHKGFQCVGNPYSCSIDGASVLGHSGQPVEDLLRCTRLRSPVDALATCLEALHLAPTAPDTLATHPFADEDPLVLGSVPHILFSGGHDQCEHEWRASARGGSGTLCVCVPAFHRQPAIVLVNLQDPRDVRVQIVGDVSEDDGSMEDVPHDTLHEVAQDVAMG